MQSANLHIISWNVAGWDATVKYIKTHYKSVESFLERHNADILALQEVKITSQKLRSDPAAAHAFPCGSYESFWACPVVEGNSTKSAAKRGFNGCTTYARKGLTIAADPAPLGDPALDAEGRCLLTDHGDFVVINVYAHATHGDDYESKLALKLRFFTALSSLMDRLRAKGKRVVLCGDLNVAARGADAPWKQSLIPIASLRLSGDEAPTCLGAAVSEDAKSAVDLAETARAAAAEAAESAAIARLHAALGGTSGCRSLAMALTSGGPRGVLHGGKIMAAVRAVLAGRAGRAGDGGGDGGEDGGEECGEEGDAEDRHADEAVASALASNTSAREAADEAAAALASLAHWVGVSPSQRDCVAWLRSLVDQSRMVDTFATIRPAASHRFTCTLMRTRTPLSARALIAPSLRAACRRLEPAIQSTLRQLWQAHRLSFGRRAPLHTCTIGPSPRRRRNRGGRQAGGDCGWALVAGSDPRAGAGHSGGLDDHARHPVCRAAYGDHLHAAASFRPRGGLVLARRGCPRPIVGRT